MKNFILGLVIIVILITGVVNMVFSSVDISVKGDIKIFYQSGKYYEDGKVFDPIAGNFSIEKKIIDEQAVNNLIKLASEDIGQDQLFAQLGINKIWLEDRAKSAVGEFLKQGKFSEDETRKIENLFVDEELVKQLLLRNYKSGITDNYPTINIAIKTKEDEVINISSKSQFPFMLPWKITRNGKEFDSNNTSINKAIISLLPKEFEESKSLNGKNLEHFVAALLYLESKK
ncbi:MAG: hypothetical protein HQL27_06230 [Candidatus Omnitrophica bacterium]|nr:hypothetical protein [Candidatus Omnitrophota bacterium]